MPSKIRLLTRAFDITVEGDSVSDVGQLLDAVEKRGLMIAQAKGAQIPAAQPPLRTSDAQNADLTEMLVGPSLFDAPPAQTPVPEQSDGGVIMRVLKREGDTYILSPKFPPSADGSERVESAAMVILAGYDQSGDAPVTGSRLLKSLKLTGYALDRVDYALSAHEQQALILVGGRGRARRYSLSEAGRAEARRLARELASLKGQATLEEATA